MVVNTMTHAALIVTFVSLLGSLGERVSAEQLRGSDTVQSFPVGKQPLELAFDGENIWVANHTDGALTKLRASDGQLQGTFAVGPSPEALVFDGANIWVAVDGESSVKKLRASDGTLLGTFGVAAAPRGITYDGANIWVTNFIEGMVTKIRGERWHNPRHVSRRCSSKGNHLRRPQYLGR